MLFLTSSPVWAADFLEVYRQALASDPLLREADANRQVAMETRPQARSLLLPQLSFNAIRMDRAEEGTRPQFSVAGTSGFPTDDDHDRTILTLQLTQTVFRWDQWLSLRQADKIVSQADVDYNSAEQDLVLRVAERYFNVLSARDELESARGNKEAIARQLEQSETRFEVGLIAITDVQESRAAYDQAVASEILAKRVLTNAHENLREITGAYAQDLENPDTSLPLVLPEPADEEAWVKRGMEQNLNLLSSRLGVQIAKDSVKVQRAGHLPTLDLVAGREEFDLDGTSLDNLLRPTPLEGDTSTDRIELRLNFPLYGGGRVSSQVREAVHQHSAARQRLERVARETERQTRDAYVGVASDISTINALEKALESAETALKATEAGFEVGTRTTVDVLDARRDLLSARTNLERSRYDYIINLLRLKQAAGTLTEADVVEINDWLN
ncbi:MAG: TolC family outer membrane protein [Gammaproteobacteria bacterium]|nr:TolC family outer membrane protein [Gammaproteobacteria bacterium]MDH3767289.1 TolC family outer membrane protein [Gammaproteobacteria bacterium]